MRYPLILILLVLVLPLSAAVKLSTLPERDSVRLRFEDDGQVLVTEQRALSLLPGANTIDFTWLSVQAERESIQLLPVGGQDFNVIRTTYPPGQDTSLQWAVAAPQAGIAEVQIAYLLAGLSRSVSYRAVVNAAEDALALELRQELANHSGEDFDQAIISAAFGGERQSPLRNGARRRQLLWEAAALPFAKRYSYDPQRFGEAVVVHYVLQNQAAVGLGQGILPAGKLRLFRETAQGEAFLGEDWAAACAVGDDWELRIGELRDLTVRRAPLGGQRQILQRASNGRPVLWHQDRSLRFEVENFTDGPRSLRLHEQLQPGWQVVAADYWLEERVAPEEYEPRPDEPMPAPELERESANELLTTITLPAQRRAVLELQIRLLNRH